MKFRYKSSASDRIFRLVTNTVILVFTALTLTPPGVSAQAVIPPSMPSAIIMPGPGEMVPLSRPFTPSSVRGLTIYPENQLKFDFIIDQGEEQLIGNELNDRVLRLIRYFMAALTVPEDEQWVNLSPHEKERIIPEGFSVTEMGRDLLAQDYLLKQLTASLMNPMNETGHEFWGKIYKKAHQLYGTTDIPVDTFHKIWIVPESATVYEHGNSAFVVRSHLKVMLEEDYRALKESRKDEGRKTKDEENTSDVSRLSYNVIREVMIPAIEQEVNEGKNFAALRQIVDAMVLATWYKRTLKDSLLGRVYTDQNKVDGIEIEDKQVKEKIYRQYMQAFKRGAYNFIKEDYDPATQSIVPRKYFSGGFAKDLNLSVVRDLAMIPEKERRGLSDVLSDRAMTATVLLNENGVSQPDASMTGKVETGKDITWEEMVKDGYGYRETRVEGGRLAPVELHIEFLYQDQIIEDGYALFFVYPEQKVIVSEYFAPGFPVPRDESEKVGRGRAFQRHFFTRPEYEGFLLISDARELALKSYRKMTDFNPEFRKGSAWTKEDRFYSDINEVLNSFPESALTVSQKSYLNLALWGATVYRTVPPDQAMTGSVDPGFSHWFSKQGYSLMRLEQMDPQQISDFDREILAVLNQTVHQLNYTPLTIDYLHNQVRQADQHLSHVVMDSQGDLVAFAIARAEEGEVWLSYFGVAEPHRGKGVARALMQAFARQAKRRGFDTIKLTTLWNNAAAIRMYEGFGFRVVDDFKALPYGDNTIVTVVDLKGDIDEVLAALDGRSDDAPDLKIENAVSPSGPDAAMTADEQGGNKIELKPGGIVRLSTGEFLYLTKDHRPVLVPKEVYHHIRITHYDDNLTLGSKFLPHEDVLRLIFKAVENVSGYGYKYYYFNRPIAKENIVHLESFLGISLEEANKKGWVRKISDESYDVISQRLTDRLELLYKAVPRSVQSRINRLFTNRLNFLIQSYPYPSNKSEDIRNRRHWKNVISETDVDFEQIKKRGMLIANVYPGIQSPIRNGNGERDEFWKEHVFINYHDPLVYIDTHRSLGVDDIAFRMNEIGATFRYENRWQRIKFKFNDIDSNQDRREAVIYDDANDEIVGDLYFQLDNDQKIIDVNVDIAEQHRNKGYGTLSYALLKLQFINSDLLGYKIRARFKSSGEYYLSVNREMIGKKAFTSVFEPEEDYMDPNDPLFEVVTSSIIENDAVHEFLNVDQEVEDDVLTEQEKDLLDLIWSRLSFLKRMRKEARRANEIALKNIFEGYEFNEFQKLFFGAGMELYEAAKQYLSDLDIVIEPQDYKELDEALYFSTENIQQHGQDYGALMVKFEKVKDTVYLSFVLMDSGKGFLNKVDDRHAPIHEAVKPGVSFGKGGVQGLGLTKTLNDSDYLSILTVSKIEGQRQAYFWRKGTDQERQIKDPPVARGSRLYFVKKVRVKDKILLQEMDAPDVAMTGDGTEGKTNFPEPLSGKTDKDLMIQDVLDKLRSLNLRKGDEFLAIGAAPQTWSMDGSIPWERLLLSMGLNGSIYQPNNIWAREWQDELSALRLDLNFGRVNLYNAEFDSKAVVKKDSVAVAVMMSVLSDPSMGKETGTRLLKDVVRALKPDGYLILGWYNTEHDQFQFEERYRTENVLEALVDEGYEFTRLESGASYSHRWNVLQVTEPRGVVEKNEVVSLDQAMMANKLTPDEKTAVLELAFELIAADVSVGAPFEIDVAQIMDLLRLPNSKGKAVNSLLKEKLEEGLFDVVEEAELYDVHSKDRAMTTTDGQTGSNQFDRGSWSGADKLIINTRNEFINVLMQASKLRFNGKLKASLELYKKLKDSIENVGFVSENERKSVIQQINSIEAQLKPITDIYNIESYKPFLNPSGNKEPGMVSVWESDVLQHEMDVILVKEDVKNDNSSIYVIFGVSQINGNKQVVARMQAVIHGRDVTHVDKIESYYVKHNFASDLVKFLLVQGIIDKIISPDVEDALDSVSDSAIRMIKRISKDPRIAVEFGNGKFVLKRDEMYKVPPQKFGSDMLDRSASMAARADFDNRLAVSDNTLVLRNGDLNLILLDETIQKAATMAGDKLGVIIEASVVGGLQYLQTGIGRKDIDIILIMNNEKVSLPYVSTVFLDELGEVWKAYDVEFEQDGKKEVYPNNAIFEEKRNISFNNRDKKAVQVLASRSWTESARHVFSILKDAIFHPQAPLSVKDRLKYWVAAEFYLGNPETYQQIFEDYHLVLAGKLSDREYFDKWKILISTYLMKLNSQSFITEKIEKVIARMKQPLVAQSKITGDDNAMTAASHQSFETRHRRYGGRDLNDAPGGIDLDPVNMDLQIKRDARGVPLPVGLQDFESIRVNGFQPVIINIAPVVNVPLLLGLADEGDLREARHERDLSFDPSERASYNGTEQTGFLN